MCPADRRRRTAACSPRCVVVRWVVIEVVDDVGRHPERDVGGWAGQLLGADEHHSVGRRLVGVASVLGSTICSVGSNGVSVETETIASPLALVWSIGTLSGTSRLNAR